MLDVTCAIIERHGMVLAVCRGEGMHLQGLWEFPGGKLHQGESPDACVVREVWEELSLMIEPQSRLSDSVHEYPGKTVRLIPFVCELKGGAMELREHSEARWLWPEDLRGIELCPADRPVLDEYLQRMG